jgi:hypothetical protein
MSMQRIYNYGSSLQAYGLRRLIEGVSDDIEVSFVDYRPGEVLVKDSSGSAPTSKLGRVLSKVVEHNSVDATLSDKVRFFNHKRTYGKRYFPMLGIPRSADRDLDLDTSLTVTRADAGAVSSPLSPSLDYRSRLRAAPPHLPLRLWPMSCK